MKQDEHNDSGFLPGAGVKGLIIVIVLVIAIVAVAAVAMDDDDDNGTDSNNSGTNDDNNSSSSDDDNKSDDSDNTNVNSTTTELTDGTTDAKTTIILNNTDYITAEVTTNDSGANVIRATLADSVASSYSSFNWYVKDSNGNTLGSISKTDPWSEWTFNDNVGTYTFGVECIKSHSSLFPRGGFWDPYGIFSTSDDYEMSLTISFSGTVTKTYTWTYDSHDYTTTVSYDYSEFQKYSGTSAASYTQRSTFDDLTSFIVVNDVVSDLQSELASEYTSTYSTTASGQGYAEFILAFVQIAYSYLYDDSTYGQDEYYAYPMETIQNGGGDCEDTSILAAALFKAAGYSAGVFLIPGHCIAAVALDSYTAGSVASGYSSQVALFSYTYTDGKTYYGCETTLDENLYGIGWISNTYSIDSDGEVYYTTTNFWGQSSTSKTTTYNGRTVTYKSLGYGFYPATA